MAFPLSFLLFSSVIFDVPAKQMGDIVFSPFFYITAVLGILGGIGLWEMKRWGWYVFVACQFFMLYYSASVAVRLGETHHKALAIFCAWLVYAVIAIRIRKEVRVPYFLPRIRWWESKLKEYPPILVEVIRSEANSTPSTIEGQIEDLSEKGCFIKSQYDLQSDEKVTVDFKAFETAFRISGIVVWVTQPSVTLPKGFGVKFKKIPRNELKSLRLAARQFESIFDLLG